MWVLALLFLFIGIYSLPYLVQKVIHNRLDGRTDLDFWEMFLFSVGWSGFIIIRLYWS